MTIFSYFKRILQGKIHEYLNAFEPDQREIQTLTSMNSIDKSLLFIFSLLEEINFEMVNTLENVIQQKNVV